MSEIQHMGSGRKAVNFFGAMLFLLIGLLMTLGGQWAGLLLVVLCGYFLFQNFIKPTFDANSAVAPSNTPEPIPNSAVTNTVVDPATSASSAPSSRKSRFKSAGGAVIIIAFVFIGGRVVSQGIYSTGNGTPVERAQTLLTSKEDKEYVSSEHGIRAVFPGFPEIERDTVDVSGYAIPYTFYLASIDGNTDARSIYVFDYSVATSDPADINLEGAFNGMVQNSDSGQIISTGVSSLGGVEGLGGHYQSSLDGVMTDSYARLAKVGTKLYVAWSVGIPKSSFDSFAESFRFE